MLTHPDKLLFPDEGITKRDLAAYYEMVAPVMLPHVIGRPVTMERYPSGIGAKGFMHKNVSKGFPAWLERVEVPKSDGSVNHALASDTRSLLWMANQNTITLHVWASRVPRLFHPDVCVFDLDPADDDPPRLRRSALALRDLLLERDLVSWIKTSGSKGYHIVVPLDAAADFSVVGGFAHRVGAELVARNPEDLTQEFSKADRGGRIYVDTGRNGYSATFAAAYTVRARPGAPISAPCTWEEVEQGTIAPRSVTLRNAADRIGAVGDLWADMLERRQTLPEMPREKTRRSPEKPPKEARKNRPPPKDKPRKLSERRR